MGSQEKDNGKVLKATLKTFPFISKAAELPRSDMKTALEWKETFEQGIKTILANLEKETNGWREEKVKALNDGFEGSARAYEELITFNKGRIFSLKQILGEL